MYTGQNACKSYFNLNFNTIYIRCLITAKKSISHNPINEKHPHGTERYWDVVMLISSVWMFFQRWVCVDFFLYWLLMSLKHWQIYISFTFILKPLDRFQEIISLEHEKSYNKSYKFYSILFLFTKNITPPRSSSKLHTVPGWVTLMLFQQY